MKSTELRIGNLVYSPNHKENYKVIRLELDSEINAEPIPLTEEWLIRFGFEKPAHSWNGKIFHLSEWDEFPNNWMVAMDKNGAVLMLKLKYVHQLQNLYWCLCGEELEIKSAVPPKQVDH